MNQEFTSSRNSAINRFERARRQASFDVMAARLTGRDTRLLPFEAIRREMQQQNPMYQGVQQVATNLIVGSVGRYKEFTRQFLPLNDSLRERWIGVDTLAEQTGWPPIDVYQVGQLYFVKDGNHRVSVARQLEMPTIEADVWAFPEDVQIGSDERLDAILLKLGERNFMAKTNLDGRFPDHNIRFTSPGGRYAELLAQIHRLRKTLALIDGEEMAYDEAVAAWYEIIYLPTLQIIHDSNILADFPGRTEADLFIWLSKHRDRLRESYGDYDNLADLAQMLADKYKEGSIGKVKRQIRRLLGSEELPPLDSDLESVGAEAKV